MSTYKQQCTYGSRANCIVDADSTFQKNELLLFPIWWKRMASFAWKSSPFSPYDCPILAFSSCNHFSWTIYSLLFRLSFSLHALYWRFWLFCLRLPWFLLWRENAGKKERKKGFIDALSQQKWWKIVESWRHYSCKMRGNNAKGKYYLPPKSLPLPLCSPIVDGIYTNASCHKHINFPTIKNISLFEVLNDQVSSWKIDGYLRAKTSGKLTREHETRKTQLWHGHSKEFNRIRYKNFY